MTQRLHKFIPGKQHITKLLSVPIYVESGGPTQSKVEKLKNIYAVAISTSLYTTKSNRSWQTPRDVGIWSGYFQF